MSVTLSIISLAICIVTIGYCISVKNELNKIGKLLDAVADALSIKWIDIAEDQLKKHEKGDSKL